MGPGRMTLKEFAAFFQDHFTDQYMVIYTYMCRYSLFNFHSNCCMLHVFKCVFPLCCVCACV